MSMKPALALWLPITLVVPAFAETGPIEVDPDVYQQTLDSLFGYIILGLCVLAVLGVILGFGSITVSTGSSRSSRSRGGNSGGSSGGGGASSGW